MNSTRKTIAGLIVLVALSATLTGCQRPIVIDASLSGWCSTNSPEQPTPEQYATYSEKQKEKMATHNDLGERYCGWKP